MRNREETVVAHPQAGAPVRGGAQGIWAAGRESMETWREGRRARREGRKGRRRIERWGEAMVLGIDPLGVMMCASERGPWGSGRVEWAVGLV